MVEVETRILLVCLLENVLDRVKHAAYPVHDVSVALESEPYYAGRIPGSVYVRVCCQGPHFGEYVAVQVFVHLEQQAGAGRS